MSGEGQDALKAVSVNPDWVNRDEQQLRLQVLDRVVNYSHLFGGYDTLLKHAEIAYRWVKG